MNTEKLINYTDQEIKQLVSENRTLKQQEQNFNYDIGVLQHLLHNNRRGHLVSHVIYIVLIIFILFLCT
jgi:hypothetical protein